MFSPISGILKKETKTIKNKLRDIDNRLVVTGEKEGEMGKGDKILWC